MRNSINQIIINMANGKQERERITKIMDILINKYGNEVLTELEYVNPYTLLVATMLSAQATDKMVNKITHELFKVVKTPENMLSLGEEELNSRYIHSINYHNSKARNIMAMSKRLVDSFNSKVPDNMDDLLTLRGVGRKTANIILNIVYHRDAIAVDTHVFRVTNRLNMVKAKNPKEAEEQLMKVVPKKYVGYVNNLFVMFGRYECKSQKPKCVGCELRQYCGYEEGINIKKC